MNNLFSRDLCAALVLSFGHFLWIGTLIAVVTAVAVRRQRTAEARYRVWLAALIAMATSPFVTLVVLQSMPSMVTPIEAVPSPTSVMSTAEQQAMAAGGNGADTDVRRMGTPARPLPNDEGQVSSEGGRAGVPILQGGLAANGSTEQQSTVTDTLQRESAWWRDYAPLVMSLYLIGVALMGLRLSLGLWGGRRLRNKATLITERSLLDALQRQADALRMKFVPTMAYCDKVTVPTVLGILKPMILLPVSLASGLTLEQIESVLAHELAHLRRYDHLVNLMQCVIESVLFFHPAVWWVSRRIRDEREHCCDDLVVACGAVPLDYATSLLRVAELSREVEQRRGHNQRRSFTAVSLFATGDRPPTLRQRIARLLGYQTEMNVRAVHPWLLCCLATCCLGAIWFLSSMTLVVLAEINRDRTQKTVIVEWSAIVDDSVMNEIRAINGLAIQETGAMQTPDDAKYTTLRCSAEELRTVLKNHADNKRLVALQKTIRHSMPTGGWSIGSEKRFFQMIDSDVVRTGDNQDPSYPLNWYADGHETRDEDSDRAHLVVEGNYNFQQMGMVPVQKTENAATSDIDAEPKQQTGTIPSKVAVKFDSMMSDGEATLIVLSPPPVIRQYQELVMDAKGSRNEAKTKQAPKLHAIFVHEAVRVPVKQLDQFHKLTRVEDWVRRGANATREHVARITEWQSHSSRDVFDKNAKWTHAMPHGGEIQLVGLGRPSTARMIWWTPNGEPLKGVADHNGDGHEGLVAVIRVSEQGVSRGIPQPPGMVSSNGVLDVAPHLMGGGDSLFSIVPAYFDPKSGEVSLEAGAGFGQWTAEATIGTAKDSTATVGGLEIKFGNSNQSAGHGPFPTKTTSLFWSEGKGDEELTVLAIKRDGSLIDREGQSRTVCRSPGYRQSNSSGHFTHTVAAADIKQFVLKSRPNHWTKFTGFATEPVTPLNPPLNFPKRHIAQLPDGVSVEFVGLAAMVDQPQQWWRPDGAVLSPSPSFKPGIGIVSMTGHDGPVEMRWAQIQVRGVGDDYRGVTANMTFHPIVEQLPSGEKVMSFSGGLQRDANKKTAVVRVGVATEPLSPVRVLDANGQRRPRPSDAPVDHIAEDIAVTGVRQLDGRQKEVEGKFVPVTQTELAFEMPTAWRQPDLRIVAIDKSGQTHHTSGAGGNLPSDANSKSTGMSKGTVLFQLPPEQIDRFEYQFRLYRHWAIFENVAFDEGDMTRLVVSTDSLPAVKPQHYVANLTDGRSVEFVGITKNTAPATNGWKPDGRPIGEVGYWPATTYIQERVTGTFVENGEHPEPLASARDFLFRFRGLKDQPSLAFVMPTNKSGYPNLPIKEPYELRVSVGLRGDPPLGGKWTTPDDVVRVGLTDDPWGQWLQVSPDGKTLNPLTNEDHYRSHYEKLQIVGVKPHERASNNLALVLKHSGDTPSQFDFQIRGIDADGKEQRVQLWESYGRDGNLHEDNYGLASDEKQPLARYEFRLRPYRHWVTFKGVSLEAGKTSDVKVSVETVEEAVGRALLPVSDSKGEERRAGVPIPRAESKPPDGLEFLTPYPKLHGLSLDMTEPQFLEIVKQQELKTRKTVDGDKVQHHITLGDGHTLIVMFGKNAKCSGIQRIRGGDGESIRVILKLNRKEFLLGESIAIDYEMTNDGMEEAPYGKGGFYPDLRINDGFRMSAVKVDENGKPIGEPVTTWPMPQNFGGPVGGFKLKPGEKFSTTLFVTRYLKFLEPGRYRLRVENVNRLEEEPKNSYSSGETYLTLKQPTPEEARRVFEQMKQAPQQAYDDNAMTFLPGAADFQAMHQPIYLPILKEYAAKSDRDALQSLQRMERIEANEVLVATMASALDRDDWRTARACFQHLKTCLPFPNWFNEPLSESDAPYRARVARLWKPGFGPALTRLAKRMNVAVASLMQERKSQPLETDANDREFLKVFRNGYFPPEHPQSLLVDIDFIYRCIGQSDDFSDCLAAFAHSIELTKTLPLETNQYFRPRGSASGFEHTVIYLLRRGAKAPNQPTHPGEAAAFAIALRQQDSFRPAGWQAELMKWLKSDSPYLAEIILNTLPAPIPAEILDYLPTALAHEYIDLQIAACHVAQKNPRPAYREPIQRILDTAKDEYLRKYAVDAARANGIQAKYDANAPFVDAEKENAAATAPPDGVQTLRKPALLLPDHWIMQAVGFDNGGKELVTASNQSFITIRRWDVVGMKLISEIKLQGDKHGRAFREGTLMFSGDRRRVVAATDEYVGIWETATGKLLKQLPFKTKEGIYDCAIDKLDCTPDLSVIVGHRALPGRLTLSYDAHVIVWDGVSGNVLQTVIDKGATDLKAIDLSMDGKRLVTTDGGGANVWETSTGKLLRSIPNDNTGRKHSEPDVISEAMSHVWSVQFSPDGRQLAMGDILGVKLLDATSGKLLQQLEGPYRYSSGASPGLVFSKDGQRLARLGTQEKAEGDKHRYVVPIWSTRTGARLFDLHTEANDAAFSDDGQRLAVVFSDMQQALSVWTLSGDASTDVGRALLPVDSSVTGKSARPTGPGPHSRQDRVEENGHYVGQTAAEFIDKFQPTWGDTKLGLQYGLALTKPQRQRTFRSGERVPLVVFIRNASDKPIKFDTAPDFFGNTPKVLNAKGEPIALENIPLLGHIPHYHEKLAPGEALGPFYLNFGLGENPRPGQQHWHPYFKTPVAGQYKLTHSASINFTGQKDGEPSKRDGITSSTIDFEIVDGQKVSEVGPPQPQGPRPQTRQEKGKPAGNLGEQPPDAPQGRATEVAQAANPVIPAEVFARRVSLNAKELPLREALAGLARAARVPLRLDEPALAEAKLDLNAPVTVTITDEPLGDALTQLIDWWAHPGVFRELRDGAVFLTTLSAAQERTARVLPDWLKPVYNQGLLVTLGDDDQIVAVTAGDALTDELFARFKSLPKLRELEIGSTTKITAAGLAHLAELTGLEKLSLSSLNQTGEGLGDEALQHVVGLKSLRELRLNECGTTDAGIRRLEGLPQLTQLDVYQEGRLTDAAIASIATLKRLTHLRLTSYVGTERWGFMRFSSESLRQLSVLRELEILALPGQTVPADFLLEFPRLTALDLQGEFVTDATAERIAQRRTLRSLSVSSSQITDDGWKRIATLPELRRLSLRREAITDVGVGHLKGLTKLEHLEMRTGSLTDEALAHLAEIKSLTRLDLWGSGSTFGGGGSDFTVIGLQQLKRLPNLRTLWLTNLEDAGGYGGLKELTQLRELVFEMANISQQEFNDLEAALPKTSISAGNGAGHLRSIRRPHAF